MSLPKKRLTAYSPKYEAEVLKDLDEIELKTFDSVKAFRKAVDNGEI